MRKQTSQPAPTVFTGSCPSLMDSATECMVSTVTIWLLSLPSSKGKIVLLVTLWLAPKNNSDLLQEWKVEINRPLSPTFWANPNSLRSKLTARNNNCPHNRFCRIQLPWRKAANYSSAQPSREVSRLTPLTLQAC